MVVQWHQLEGALAETFSLTNVQPEQVGSYSVVVTNELGWATSAPAILMVLTPPVITLQPSNQTAVVGTTVSFSVVATSTEPLNYQWQFNGTDLEGAVAGTLNLSNVQPEQAGSYGVVVSHGVGSVTSAPATLTVLTPPAITLQPTNQTALVGATVSFSVVASGTAPLSYQWLFNGTNIEGALAETFSLTNVQPEQVGSYSVVVTNELGWATSAPAILMVLTPPVITLQPSNQTAVVGATVNFSVAASGTALLGYQWSFNGTNLEGAVAETFSLTNVQPDQAGTYSVVVSNVIGSVTSAPTTLTVLTAPAITLQPINQTALVGTTANFSVAASGTRPLSYRWQFNGTELEGALAKTLTLTNVQPERAGSYSVVVSNGWGSATSVLATLTVLHYPVLLDARMVTNGAFGFTLSGDAGRSYVIEVSTNLLEWTPLSTLSNAVGQVDFTDLAPVGSESRFYRARLTY